MGDRFTVTLLYPGGERPTHPYTVFRGMPVSFLRYNLACLLRCELPVSLFVGPHWVALAHSGTITDRVFPGTTLLCPYVEQGTEIRVQAAPATLLDTLVLVAAPLFDPGASLAPDVEVLSSLPRDAVPEEWGAITTGSTIAPDIPPQDGWAWGVPDAVPFKPTWGGLKGYDDRLDDMRIDKEWGETQVCKGIVALMYRINSGLL